MNILETVVCSSNAGVEARLERMISARVEFRKRQAGCLKSWYGKSVSDESLFIFQTVFQDVESMKEISKRSSETLDIKDQGIESCLIGPPLIGIFEISVEDIDGL
tara:strand:- start:380 stop:694 length:315 start_codon:yes stop_codon:yes gene_type:complete